MEPLVRISDIGSPVLPKLIYLDALGNLPRKNDTRLLLLRCLMLSFAEMESGGETG